ncbi:MAG TPA: methyltransferase domain-containing protein [Polyangiaceae bacterium]|jgi:trans-aconitate methyltransferase|nr:methyltransferase domain-containing protein [Polyangiaceae bacterium]
MFDGVHVRGMDSTWNPALYDDRASFVSELASELVVWLRPKERERILDLGCGTGTLTAEIARHGAVVTGVDRSQEMIASAREKYSELRFDVVDGQELAYSSEFEAVFSNAALHWMPRAADVVRGVQRALVPGGRFVAEFGGAGCVATVNRAVSEILNEWQIDPAPYLSWFFPSPGAYASLLEAEGLTVRELRYFERATPVPGADGLATWLGLFQARLMADLGSRGSELCHMASDRCRPRLFRDGRWLLDYVRLRVIASKP